MEVNKKIVVGVFSMLVLGIVLVSAGSFYEVNDVHEQMIQSDDFEAMHEQMMAGNFEAANEYHDKLGLGCPMHDLITSEDVSLEEFKIMQGWMMTGEFPKERPAEISIDAWNVHMSHHSEIYG